MDLGLKDQVVLAVASSQGIGLAAAKEFAREGAKVLLTSRNEAHLTAAREALAELPGQVETMTGDVTQAEDCQRIVAACQERYGRLDVLFTNAGGPSSGGFFDVDEDQYQRALDLNLLSIVYLCRAAVPIMKEQRYGRIVALTSISVKQPIAGLLLSNTARAGAQGFLKSLANEVAAFGITVNTVCPGYTNTERLRELADAVATREGSSPAEVYKEWAAGTPAARIGEPEEIAAYVAFLGSRRASYMTGTAVAVDGGRVQSLL